MASWTKSRRELKAMKVEVYNIFIRGNSKEEGKLDRNI